MNRLQSILVCGKLSVTLVILFSSNHAFADEQDTFNLIAGKSTKYESNIFRLPDNATPLASTGKSERWDILNLSNIGINFDKQYSLQRFKADYTVTSYKFQNFDYLDFDAKNYKFAWLWQLTPDLTGNIFREQKQALSSMDDFRNNSRQNIITTTNNNFDFDYSAHGALHIIGKYSDLSAINSQVFIQQTSYASTNIEGGLKYVFNSQSYVSLSHRDTTGQLVGQSLNAALLLDDGFTQTTEDLSGLWLIGGKSSLVFDMAYTAYKSNNFSQRDFSGVLGFIAYQWAIFPKTALTLNYTRKLEPFVTTVSSYAVSNTLNLMPTWTVSPKLSLAGNLSVGNRNFLGEGPSVSNNPREDSSISYGFDLNWSPRSYVLGQLSFKHQMRNSTQNSFDYSDNSVTAGAQFEF